MDAQADSLWLMDALRGSTSRQTSTPRNDTNPIWSPDGTRVMYSDNDPKTRSDLWTLPLGGQRTPEPFLKTDASECCGRFSPDGSGSRTSPISPDEVYVRAFPSGDRATQISVNGGVEPVWALAGRELLFLGLDPELLQIARQIADALDKAHRQGLIHRDLKPANVMLAKRGAGRHGAPDAKLLDFGLARPVGIATADGDLTSPTISRSLTHAGTIVGTFHYMAPEQLEGADVDARSDVWSLGATLYEMATGRRPFDAPSTPGLMSAILRDEPRPTAELQPAIPPSLDRVIRQCLAKDPDERWQSAGDLRRELEWIAAAPAAAMTTAPAPHPAGVTGGRDGRRRRCSRSHQPSPAGS